MFCAYKAFEQGDIFIDSELLQNLGLVYILQRDLYRATPPVLSTSCPARDMGPRFRGIVQKTAPM